MINPIAKKRFEEQKNTYIAEERKLQELGAKRKAEEKEREDFAAGLGLFKTDTGFKNSVSAQEEDLFFREVKDISGIDDRKDENWNKDFQKGLLEENQKEEKQKYLSPYMQAKQNTSDKIYETYESGEEWLMSEGADDFAKGIINNFRSSVGETVEDMAYAINDFAPWYKPAGEVLSERTAGKIRDKAERQFENAKEKTGDFGDKAIDAADSLSEALGYSVFGFKAGSHLQEISEGFDRYRSLREKGYSKAGGRAFFKNNLITRNVAF